MHAGIVSHHLFVAGYISDYFAAIKKIDDSGLIKTFIIIGPNHRSRGNALISLSERQWKTPYGFLKPDLSMVRELCRLNGASIDEDAFYNEPSIGALLPFIAYYFPGVKIVPIVLNFRLSWEGAELLGKAIARLTGGSDIVILSADFVHERLNRAAQILDRKSGRLLRRPLEDHSPDEISGIEIDCRKGLMTLFNFMRGKKKCRAEILLNTNYAVVSGKDDPATSYFFVIY
ncbi:MAG: AmmeMemoRadiSam system protein B, partial [Proteobacteria bacterium]|nr:AmmeMemoRadiSam system protein B [Pseudomonadota bacterium]